MALLTSDAIDSGNGETIHNRPQFLPGDRLLLTVLSKSPESPQFGVVDLKTGTRRIVARGGNNGQYVASGHLTFIRQDTLFAVPFDLDRLTTTGPEVPLIEGISTLSPPGTADYTVSQTGTLHYMESRIGGTLLSWASRSGVLQSIPGLAAREHRVGGRLSPDGRRMVTEVVTGDSADLWMIDLQRGVETRLTFGGANEDPVWTPDGRAIVFSMQRNDKPGIYSISGDGGRPELFASRGGHGRHRFHRWRKSSLHAGRRRTEPAPRDGPALERPTRTPHPLREIEAGGFAGAVLAGRQMGRADVHGDRHARRVSRAIPRWRCEGAGLD